MINIISIKIFGVKLATRVDMLSNMANRKVCGTLQFLRPTMFKYHLDSISEISI